MQIVQSGVPVSILPFIPAGEFKIYDRSEEVLFLNSIKTGTKTKALS
jgi:hypothetical protein